MVGLTGTHKPRAFLTWIKTTIKANMSCYKYESGEHKNVRVSYDGISSKKIGKVVNESLEVAKPEPMPCGYCR
jgi:hypothetical protein